MRNVVHVNDQLSRKDLFDAFKKQLTEDFEQSNFQADFIKALEPDFTSIHEKILLELQRSEKRAGSNLMQLLYRIDISETQLKKYLNEHSTENHLITSHLTLYLIGRSIRSFWKFIIFPLGSII